MEATSAVAAAASADAGASGDDVLRVMREDGTLDPEADPHASDDLAVRLFEEMLRLRRLDEKMTALQEAGRVAFHASWRGEEAAVLGATAALREQDWIFPSSREAGAALFRGVPLAAYVHHMFGDAMDPAKGRQAPDHFTARAVRYVTGAAPVGTQIVHATGLAWAARAKKDDVVALCFFGDGATSAADFHNGLNFAGVFRVPVVFLCRNNGTALSTPLARQTASSTLAAKAVAYGIAAARVDGTDVFAVLRAVKDAVARATSGGGATLVEALTHGRDPLARLRHALAARGLASEGREQELKDRADAELAEAVAAAAAAPRPTAHAIFEDVYEIIPAHLREQEDELSRCRK
jgi:2-oxoisovalerate dehydrogenase E1 component alpha subunit